MTRDELARALSDAAYLEGDFVLRSGRRSKYYLDKYRFETRPDLLAPLGRAIADAVREHEPEATRLAGPELGAVALAAAASLESGLPFLIVRKEAKDYGTSKRLEGVFERGRARLPRSRTSSRPAEPPSRRFRRSATRVSRSRARSASSTAKRAESTRSRARQCASGRSIGRRSSEKTPQIRMVERYPTTAVSLVRRGLAPSPRRRRMFVDQAGLHPEGRPEERAFGS